jgi:hypothetical protein
MNLTKKQKRKLIGVTIDTNQFTRKVKTSKEAEEVFAKLITVYSKDILEYMCWNGRAFSTYAKDGMKLSTFLEEAEK